MMLAAFIFIPVLQHQLDVGTATGLEIRETSLFLMVSQIRFMTFRRNMD
jgi:hypothetical protein